MVSQRHTKMAPAAIQRQWQRIWIPAHVMVAGDVTPAASTKGLNRVWSFHPDTKQDVVLTIPVPLDWIAGTDAYAYPVFCTTVNLYATIRWGLTWLGILRGQSVGGGGNTIEGNFDADGTGFVNPPKSQWLKLTGSGLGIQEDAFQRGDFTELSAVSARLYRAATSAFDNHPGYADLLGLVIMYQAFV